MYRFQDMTFHPGNGVLESATSKHMLRPKTAQILLILIQNANELVTKEHLLEAVWPDSHVSSGNLVQSIQEIRRALGDSAKEPRFVQTFPRRGYQWLVPVTLHQETLATSSQQENSKKAIDKSHPKGLVEPSQTRPSSSRLPRFLAFGLFTLMATLLWVRWLTEDSVPVALETNQSRLVLLPIVDQTQNPSLEWMGPGIYELLNARLQDTETFQVLSQVQVGETLANLGIRTNQLDNEEAQKLLKKVDAHMLLQGQIHMVGSQFKYAYQLTKAAEGTANGSFSFSNPLDISGKIAKLLEAHPLPLKKGLRFSSIEAANQDYFRGKLALDTKSAPLAKRYFEAALLLDPEFETARLALARTIYLMGDLLEAERLYLQILARVENSDDNYSHILALLNLGRIDWRVGEMLRSNQRINKALDLSRKQGFPKLEARSLRLLSWHAIHVGDWKKHDAFQEQARELAADFTDEKSTADALYYMGSSDSPLHDFEQGRHLLHMALDYYKRTGALSDLAYTYLALGKNRTHTPKQQESYHLQALEIFEQLGYDLVIPGIWEGLALCYAQQLHPLKLKQHILTAHRHYEAEQHKGDLANTQFLLAVAEVMIGLDQKDAPLADYLERAEFWLDQCHDFHMDQKIISRQASSALMRGMIAMERNDLNLADQYFTNALEIFNSLEFPEGIAVCAIAHAALALERGDWQAALDWSARAENVYPQRPGLWQPYAIYAYIHMGQKDTALQIAKAFAQSARPTAAASAANFYAYCRKVSAGESAAIPPLPNILSAYFQSY